MTRTTRPTRPTRPTLRDDHPLHPAAWWAWALGLALLTSRVQNPLLLALVIAVTGYVAATCRRPGPWSRTYLVLLRFGLVVLVLRVALLSLTGADDGTHLLFTLPAATLPHWMAGVRFGGPVAAESVVSAGEQGLRLAAMLCCLGAANVSTTPSRLVKALPAALYEMGLVVTVAVSVAPQTVVALGRLRDARRMRGHPVRGPRAVRGVALPVLAEALEGSLALAAAMDSRGYGRRVAIPAARRRAASAVTVLGVLGVGVGLYGAADQATPAVAGTPLLAVSAALLAGGLVLAGARSPRTRYRADRWDLRATAVAASGLAAVVVAVLDGSEPALSSPAPLSVPGLPLAATVVVLAGLLPALLSPGPRARRMRTPAAGQAATPSAREAIP
jgi:energy-coupling factor transport system permease protein